MYSNISITTWIILASSPGLFQGPCLSFLKFSYIMDSVGFSVFSLVNTLWASWIYYFMFVINFKKQLLLFQTFLPFHFIPSPFAVLITHTLHFWNCPMALECYCFHFLYSWQFNLGSFFCHIFQLTDSFLSCVQSNWPHNIRHSLYLLRCF